MSIFQYLSARYKIPVYLAYTQAPHGTTCKPTTTYKLYTSKNKPEKYKHNTNNMNDYDTFLYKCHIKGLIFFARMGKSIVHIDPWMINADECFDNGMRNDVKAKFPESTYGYCLVTAIRYELSRYNIIISDNDIRIVENFVITE